MSHRFLALGLLLSLPTACVDEADPGGPLDTVDDPADPPVDGPADDPAGEPPADPEDPEDPAGEAEPAAVCSVGFYTIDCHANEATLVVDGQEREVLWQVPAGEAPAEGWPVVLAFHGTNDPPDKFFSWYYWSAVDQAFGGYYQLKTTQSLLESGFAVIAPKARKRTGGIYWDTNIAPYDEDWDSSPDAALMEALFAEIAAGGFGPLNTGRQYAMGLSSGGYQSSRLAVDYPEQMRAVAVQSASYATCISSLPCTVTAEDLPDDHPPTLLMAGYWDAIVPLYTIQSYMDALDDNGTDATLEVVGYASHQWTSNSPGWVLEWFQTH